MKTRKTIAMLVAVGMLLALAGAAQAATVAPTAVRASSEGFSLPSALDTINGSGLTDVGNDGNAANDTHNNHGSADTMWLSASDGTKGGENDEFLIFDLGGVYDVSSALVWNHNQSSFSRLGVKTMDISATATGTSVNDASGFTGTTGVSLTQGSELNSETAQTEALGFTGVRFVRFDNFDNYSVTGESVAGTVGLSEVRFDAVPVGPATITPTAVRASSEGFSLPSALDTINSNGLTDVGSDGNAANDTHNNHGSADTMWLSASDGTKGGENDEFLIFDLGGVYDVSSALVWNHNQSGGWSRLGVNTMDISATATGTSVNDASGFTGTTSVSLTQGSGLNSETAQTEALNFTGVRFVRFDNFDNYSTSGQQLAGTVGLSEVRFYGAAPSGDDIPEPATMCAMGLAVAALGGYVRRRRKLS